ncbi:MAG: class I SAM-dependent methyltransferase [bacterium]|nr:class I SAM-dependent methyltransferase [bacterium]
MMMNKLWLWRWDRFARYNPVIDYLHNQYGFANVSILEVGSGDYSASLYDGYIVDGMDLIKPKDPTAVRLFYNESIVDTKMQDNLYDVVICVDTFEHIPKKSRQIALYNMMRIAKKEVLLVYPSGEDAIKLDDELYSYYKTNIGDNHRWFEEHKKYGLPTESELDQYIISLNKVFQNMSVYRSRINDILKLKIYSKFMMSRSYFRFLLKNKILFLFDCFFGTFIKCDKYYRRFIIISLK